MSSALRPEPWFRGAAVILVLAAAAAAAVLARARSTLPAVSFPHEERGGGRTSPSAGDLPAVTGSVWAVFLPAPPAGRSGEGPTGVTYRLAGTFFVQVEGDAVRRKAILDDRPRGRQHIVAEGDSVGDIRVETIASDHVVLRSGSRAYEVWLEFRGPVSAASVGGPVAGVTQAITHAEGPEAGTTNRFGRQLGERRWVVRRPAVLEYYQELLDQPERMVAVFDSLKPVFDERHKVAGYLLGVEGEADFFSAAGLHEGDIVRRVNSMPMTSRRRAEFLINEFLQNRMSAVVLEIERDGRPAKLVYEVR